MHLNVGAAWARLQSILQGLITGLPNLLIGLAIFGLFLLLARAVRDTVRRLTERAQHEAGSALVFSRLAWWLTLSLGVLVALTVIVPELNAGSLFGALGVSGVAIGFAFKDIFQNLLAGLLLLFTRPFRIGDQIVSGDHEGTVEDIQLRATLIRTYDNRQVVIPNSELYTNRVVVNTAYEARRLDLALQIGRGDIERARRVIRDTLPGLSEVRADPAPQVLVRSSGDYAVNLEVRVWIDPPIRREIVYAEDQVLSALIPALLAAGIELPVPAQDVRLRGREPGDERPTRKGEVTAR